ncbi:MarR family transcriptional regulator [Sulfitobacter sp. F26204]|uniref:MarR family winged helix-turn-helix transcriptional regulator n=1 Tax=Sulfitobacter sp. F26204 TaxID=2996014 RepID=UPI00225DDA99|nr:MarR family transcriptional regulator [Sulfitobacter sp. F26204]MCX7560592.1 MarR family transcriptional regulator [Sulfitobacter sp. F26204]
MRFWLSLLRVHNTIFPELNRNLRENAGIGLAKVDLLAQLARHRDGISMSDLSTALKVTNGNVSGLVNRLVKDGLVRKEMSTSDRRSFTAKLTNEGLETFQAAMEIHQVTLAKLMADVEKDVVIEATEPLRKLAGKLKLKGQKVE